MSRKGRQAKKERVRTEPFRIRLLFPTPLPLLPGPCTASGRRENGAGEEECTRGRTTRPGEEEKRELRAFAGIPTAAVILISALMALLALAAPGCGKTHPAAEDKVEEAIRIISSSRELLEDLLGLDERFNSLGQRYPAIADTLAEGRSLAEMALVNVEELESRYSRARDLLREVVETGSDGESREYALLALQAVEPVLEAVRLNRDLLDAVHDMLDVIPMAESAEQLSYYVEEIGRLTEEISGLLRRGAEAAERADDYSREHGL